MKGSGEVLNAVLLVVIMLLLFGIVVSTAIGAENKTQRLIFDETIALKTRNVFELTLKSLDTTWLFSTVQTVFKTADSSIKCGIDDEGVLDDHYWYSYNPKDAKTSSCVDTNQCGQGNTEPRLPSVEKYNNENYNPRLCYPKDEQVLDALNTDAELFKNIKQEFDVQSVRIELENIVFSIDMEDDKINNSVSYDLKASFGNVKIEKSISNDKIVKSELKKQVAAGRDIVRDLMTLSDKLTQDTTPQYTDNIFDYTMRYQELTSAQKTNNGKEYIDKIKDYIEIKLNDAETQLSDSRIAIDYDTLKFMVPDENTIGVWNGKSNEPKTGLVLHYDATVKIIEGAGSDAMSCNENPPQAYLDYIKNAVESAGWSFNGVEYEKDEIEKLAKAVIQAESSWNPSADSGVAYGLMQITPATAAQYCSSQEYGGIDINTAPLLLIDPEINIRCGVHILHEYMNYASQHGEWKENVMKLALAHYNCGCISGNNIVYEDLELPIETQNYVPKVLGYYVCYGGTLESYGGVYYYFDEDARTIIQRAITLQLKVEDYLQAITCFEEPISTNYITGYHYSDSTSSDQPDMICCKQDEGDMLYTCMQDISGIDENNLQSGASVVCGPETDSYTATCSNGIFTITSNS